ncbi:MAG: Do family serine endopeptidase [Candidatus Omnitrophica bacterium]|nr:Do family serine endopeptidase [Candidatus Omnitrophota bacterium]
MRKVAISVFVLTGLFSAVVFAQSTGARPELVVPENTGLENAVINVAGTTGKAVVSISTEHTEKVQGSGQRKLYFNQPGGSPFGGGQNDETFRRFFDDFFGGMPDREFKQVGLGSGVIINPEGYILTNEHVVNNADKITVTLSDGRQFKGEVKGKDARSDLAVIKVSAHNLPVATLGDSDNIKIGQWVVAIGNPFAFALTNPEPTVTSGVISALHRTLGMMLAQDKDYNDLIQTDASINPGNSGGPLTNLKGEVVGINVAIFSTSGGSQGIGFAIPINNAKRIMTRLIEGKKIAYGWMGITVQNLNEDLAGYFGLPNKNGVLVAKMIENSSAQKGGMKERDVIKQFDGKPINSVRELLSAVAATEVGRKVKLLVVRDKKDLTLDIVVGERPESTENLEEATVAGVVETSKWRGLEVEEIGGQNTQGLRMQGAKGVVVIKVEPGSLADSAGIIQGEQILEINKQPITSAADYQKVTQGLKGDALIRTGRGYFIVKG